MLPERVPLWVPTEIPVLMGTARITTELSQRLNWADRNANTNNRLRIVSTVKRMVVGMVRYRAAPRARNCIDGGTGTVRNNHFKIGFMFERTPPEVLIWMFE